MAKYANQGLVGYAVKNGLLPTDGPKAVQLVLDFTSTLSYEIELEEVVELGRLPFVQSMYIDNSLNATQTLVVVCGISGQVIRVLPKTQGFYPVLMPSTKFSVTISGASAGALNTVIHLISVPMPAATWLGA